MRKKACRPICVVSHCSPPHPPISMLTRCLRYRVMGTPQDERLFRRRFHARSEHTTSTLNLGARGCSHTAIVVMSVIFANTSKPPTLFSACLNRMRVHMFQQHKPDVFAFRSLPCVARPHHLEPSALTRPHETRAPDGFMTASPLGLSDPHEYMSRAT